MTGKVFKKLNIIPALILAGFIFAGFSFYTAKAFPLAKNTLTLNVVAMGREYCFCYPEIDYYQGEPYLKNAEEVVNGMYYDTIIHPKNAEVTVLPELEYPFKFKKEKEGKAIDKEDLLLKIDRALRLGESKIFAKEVILKPYLTVEKLQKSTYRRAFFSTNYTYSSDERKENIRVCANYIGAVTLEDNQVFSFNDVVGERTEERGFKNAKIIEKGKFIDGVGGGVCQVSSTMYNAVLLSGLKVVERRQHSMAVSYVEPSFDAMVSMGYSDLKFVNNTGGVVFIIAKVDGDNITVSVYGLKTDLSYEREFVVLEKIQPPQYLKTPSSELKVGEERVVVYPKEGLISQGYLKVYKDGVLIDKIPLSKDKYAPLQGEIIYGESGSIS